MPSISKLGHVALATPDMETSLWFWRDVVGLEEVERHEETVFLRAWGEFEHHSLSLKEGPAGVDHVGWRAGSQADVDAYAQALAAAGADVQAVEAGAERGQGAAVRFDVPGGEWPFEIYFDIDRPQAPEDRRSRLKNQTARSHARGISPRTIDHVNLWCANPQEPRDWVRDNLGFRANEEIVPTGGPLPLVGTWMAVTSLVHDLGILADPAQQQGRFHHIAYYLDNSQDILRAMDILAEHGIRPDLGPGRHGISQATFCYVRDPGSGHRLELFSGGYHIYDPDWETVVWTEHDLQDGLIWWGPEYMPGAGQPLDETTPCHAPAAV